MNFCSDPVLIDQIDKDRSGGNLSSLVRLFVLEYFKALSQLRRAENMSAYGPKRTSLVAPHMSAFGGKADMATVSKYHLRLSPSRKAIASSSTRTASSMGMTGRASNTKAGSIEQNL